MVKVSISYVDGAYSIREISAQELRDIAQINPNWIKQCVTEIAEDEWREYLDHREKEREWQDFFLSIDPKQKGAKQCGTLTSTRLARKL